MCMKLGLPSPTIIENECLRCSKGSYEGGDLRHILCCKGKGVHIRQALHEAVKHHWAQLLRHAEVVTLLEDTLQLAIAGEQQNKRMDIVGLSFVQNRKTFLDVTLIEPGSKKCPASIDFTSNHLTANAEARKNAKYKDVVNKAGHMFFPLVMSTMGAWGKQARAVFDAALERIHGRPDGRKIKESLTKGLWRQIIAMSFFTTAAEVIVSDLQKQNNLVLRQRNSFLPAIELDSLIVQFSARGN